MGQEWYEIIWQVHVCLWQRDLIVVSELDFTTYKKVQIPVAVWSKVWVCGHSFAGIVGSNPAGGMWMVVSSGCCVLLGIEVSVSSWSLIQQSPTKCDVSKFDHRTLIRKGHCPTAAMGWGGGGVRSAVHRIEFLSDNRIQYITLTVCGVICIMYALLHCFECYCQRITMMTVGPISVRSKARIRPLSYGQTVSLLSSFSKTANVGHISHMKPASASSLQSIFLLQLILLNFMEESRSVDIQLSSRPCTFWRCLSTHITSLVIKYWNTVFQFFQWLLVVHTNSCLSVVPTNNSHTNSYLEI
jgi:hypothetical protein